VTTASPRPALFIDRDDTLIVDRHYLADAALVELMPGVAEALRDIQQAGIPIVIITNQSGIGRGLIAPAQYEAVRDRTESLLADMGVPILATYHCPHAPGGDIPCACRKPGTALYAQAATDHGLALAGSAYVGDRWRDIAPALTLGGIGIMVPGPQTAPADVEAAHRAEHAAVHVVATLREAVGLILRHVAGHVAGTDSV